MAAMDAIRSSWWVIAVALVALSIRSGVLSMTTAPVENFITVADFYPEEFNVSHAQTKYHLSRVMKGAVSCFHDGKQVENPVLSTSIITNCSCPRRNLIGTAAYTDWTILEPCLYRFSKSDAPRTVYVHASMLAAFATKILPHMAEEPPFVLISGGTDTTLPRQIDKRCKPFEGFTGDFPLFFAILNSTKVLRWYAENRDVSDGYDKFSTWPTGLSYARLIYPDDMSDLISYRRQHGHEALTKKPLHVLVSDRFHGDNPQMHLRREVRALCNRTPTCRVPANDVQTEHKEFIEDISSVSFVACIQGGGIDPSPKAWETILAGSIPIIKSSWLDDAYRQLPVVLVEDWDQVFFSEALVDKLYPQYFARVNSGSLGMMASSERAVNDTLYEEARRVYEERLEKWRAQLAPYYEAHSGKRREVLRRLQSAYWMGHVYNDVDRYDEAHNVPAAQRVVRRAQVRPVIEEGVEAPPHATHVASHEGAHGEAGSKLPSSLAIFASFKDYPVWTGDGATHVEPQSSFARLKKVRGGGNADAAATKSAAAKPATSEDADAHPVETNKRKNKRDNAAGAQQPAGDSKAPKSKRDKHRSADATRH